MHATPALVAERPAAWHDAYLETQLTFFSFRLAPLEGVSTAEGGQKYVHAPRPEMYDWRADPRELANQVEDGAGGVKRLVLSRQMVLFCVERRRAWRMLQSRAGVENEDYRAQRALLKSVAANELDRAAFLAEPAAHLARVREELAGGS